ncbi:unnamed protein product [Caenorhabditis bovis]|uniref:Tyrosine-protein kinase n=1 Tax=Caenorhabditis bovis TaxID=2654633 RepID=A0A8S1EYE7_9PELO|nr:unnamed protein product [Caenorhabditis bovis]
MDYFHGSIDMKECKLMLQENGDFLLRNKLNVQCNNISDNIICVLCVGCGFPGDIKVKSIGIMQEGEHFTLQGASDQFPSVKALIDSHIESKKPVAESTILVRAIVREKWELLCGDIALTDVELGKGSFGTVIKGVLKKVDPPVNVAVKIMQDGISETVFNDTLNEARVMRQLDHANIIRLHGVVIEKEPLMIVIELVDGKSLSSKLKSKGIAAGFKISFVCALAYAVHYLHEKHFIHRDIAARNVLVSNDFKDVKLIDFGLSKAGTSYCIQTPQKIPTKWLSPEVIQSGKFSQKSDVWSFAVTVWEIYNEGAEPYPNKKNADVKAMLFEKKTAMAGMLDLKTCSSDEKPPPALNTVIHAAFDFDPTHRASMEQIVTAIDNEILPKLQGAELENCKHHQNRRTHMRKSVIEPTTTINVGSKMSQEATRVSNMAMATAPPAHHSPGPHAAAATAAAIARTKTQTRKGYRVRIWKRSSLVFQKKEATTQQ